MERSCFMAMSPMRERPKSMRLPVPRTEPTGLSMRFVLTHISSILAGMPTVGAVYMEDMSSPPWGPCSCWSLALRFITRSV